MDGETQTVGMVAADIREVAQVAEDEEIGRILFAEVLDKRPGLQAPVRAANNPGTDCLTCLVILDLNEARIVSRIASNRS